MNELKNTFFCFCFGCCFMIGADGGDIGGDPEGGGDEGLCGSCDFALKIKIK